MVRKRRQYAEAGRLGGLSRQATLKRCSSDAQAMLKQSESKQDSDLIEPKADVPTMLRRLNLRGDALRCVSECPDITPDECADVIRDVLATPGVRNRAIVVATELLKRRGKVLPTRKGVRVSAPVSEACSGTVGRLAQLRRERTGRSE